MSSFPDLEPTEIAAGALQLQPLDATSRRGAIAALGRQVTTAHGSWIARDSVSASPRAYVAIVDCADEVQVIAAPGLMGTCADANQAAHIICRFASANWGLPIPSPRLVS